LAEVVAGVVVGMMFCHIGDRVYCQALMRVGPFTVYRWILSLPLSLYSNGYLSFSSIYQL
jgi:hypothetical protein